jgi:nucleoporin POM34
MTRAGASTPRASNTPTTPSTPAAQTAAQPATPSGAWKHPKFDEIAQRQYATTFDERNVRIIVVNVALLFLSAYGNTVTSKVKLLEYAAYVPFLFPLLIFRLANYFFSTPINTVVRAVPYSAWAIALLRLVFAANIVVACKPLIRRYYPDDISDIPLTPNYVTPPRYQRSTPRSGSFSQDRSSQSPMTGSPRGFAKSGSNSPFSPNMSTGSPLFQKALGGSATKRLSYDSSLFGDSSSSAAPGTPTPSTGKASVGLNNKWLYEKRRDSPRTGMLA